MADDKRNLAKSSGASGDVAAFLVEPIQGKGVHATPPGFLRAAQELLHRHKALLIADEVQTGIGRTGDFFAYQHEPDVEPDLVCVAKALSGGYVPVGATLGRDAIFRKVYSSMDRVLVHDSTFGSNAQAMAAGLATLHTIEAEDVLVAPVNEYPDVFADPQVLHNEMVLRADVPHVGEMAFVGVPVKLSDTPGALRSAPPTVGQHNEELLADLGYSSEAIHELQDDGVVGSENHRLSMGGHVAW